MTRPSLGDLAAELDAIVAAMEARRNTQVRLSLARVLAEAFSADELRKLHESIDLGPEGESPEWDRLLDALAEARES